jgi:hypothetical protein
VRDHFCANWIEFNVAAELLQIQLTLAEDGLVSALEDMTDKVMRTVEVARIFSVEVTHAAAKVTIGGFQKNMKVVGHLAVRPHLEIESFTGFPQDRQPRQSIAI